MKKALYLCGTRGRPVAMGEWTVAYGDVSELRSFLDYDAVLIDQAAVFSDFIAAPTPVNRERGNGFRIRAQQLRSAITEMKNHGRPVVVFPSHNCVQFSYVYRKVLISAEVEALVAAELPSERIEYRKGTRVELAPGVNAPWGEALNGLVYKYECCLASKSDQPLLRIVGADFVVGWANRQSGVIFLPQIESGFPQLLACLDDLYRSAMTVGVPVEQLPGWAIPMVSVREQAAIDKVAVLRDEANEVATRLVEAEEQLSSESKWKRLFTAKGPDLELIVKDSLAQIGFEILPATGNRADVRARLGEQVVVLEVKGRDIKPASEADARQLLVWKGEADTELSCDSKAILVMNAFASIPIADRVEDVFPHQMRLISERYHQCLISGLQLYCLVQESLRDPEAAKLKTTDLIGGDGVYPHYLGEDWKAWISKAA